MCLTAFHSVWALWENNVIDLTDYVNTNNVFSNADERYKFLDSDIVDVFKQQAGQDITKPLNAVLAKKDANLVNANINCMKNMFFVGNKDFRKSARCQVQNILLVVVSAILVATIAAKCMCMNTYVSALLLTDGGC
jgi:chitin synthase